jgi:hypothetical protein
VRAEGPPGLGVARALAVRADGPRDLDPGVARALTVRAVRPPGSDVLGMDDLSRLPPGAHAKVAGSLVIEDLESRRLLTAEVVCSTFF